MNNPHNFDVVAEEKQLRELVSDILQQAKTLGATQAEVGAASDNGFSINVRLGEVDTVEFQRDKSIGITVYFGQRKGTASSSDISREAIKQTVEAACDIAKYTSEDPCNGLAEKELMAFDYPDIDAYHPWSLDPITAIELARQCEAIGMTFDKRIKNSEGSSVSTNQGIQLYGNSHGFIGKVASTRHNFSCVLVAEDASGMQRDYEFTTARDPMDLWSIEEVGKKAAKRTVSRLQARSISTRNTPVIFAAEIAKSIFGSLVAAVSGGNLYRETSFLLNSLDTQVVPAWMNIMEKPHIQKALGSAAFDSEGVRTKEQSLVEKGVLQHYVLGSYSARKLGMKTTGNAGGVNNLIVENSNTTFQGLLKQMGTGLLVTEVIGHGVNITTGDYSRGAVGFWVENGEILFPVEEITIAGNLKDMLLGIQAVSNDVDVRSNIQTGSVLINNMMLAGQ